MRKQYLAHLDEEKKEKRREQNKKSKATHNAKVGRPKIYASAEERNRLKNERQRNNYRKRVKKVKTDRDLSTMDGRIGAWQDLIDAM